MKSEYVNDIQQAAKHYQAYALRVLHINYAFCQNAKSRPPHKKILVHMPSHSTICIYPCRKPLPTGTCYVSVTESIKSDNSENILYRYYGDMDMLKKAKEDDMFEMASDHFEAKILTNSSRFIISLLFVL